MAKRTPHVPGKLRFLPWPVCTSCGLIYLKNAATAATVAHGCEKD